MKTPLEIADIAVRAHSVIVESDPPHSRDEHAELLAELEAVFLQGRAERPALTQPTVHLNGTARTDLIEANQVAMTAVHAAFTALQAAAPNARDYYPQGTDAYGKAADEHHARITRLTEITNELTEILIGLVD